MKRMNKQVRIRDEVVGEGVVSPELIRMIDKDQCLTRMQILPPSEAPGVTPRVIATPSSELRVLQKIRQCVQTLASAASSSWMTGTQDCSLQSPPIRLAKPSSCYT